MSTEVMKINLKWANPKVVKLFENNRVHFRFSFNIFEIE